MDPLTFDYANPHPRVDRGVFELFALDSIEHGLLVPPPWLGVLVHCKKPDRHGELSFGVVRDPGATPHGTDREAFRYGHTPAERTPLGDRRVV